MVKMSAVYVGEKHCELEHGPSASRLETDAPKDNNGRGEKFSPTDLVCAALSSCALTTMAIFAERDGVSVKGARADASKEMKSDPRRIGRLTVHVQMPAGVPKDYRGKIEKIGRECPVARSLGADVETVMTFTYPD